MPANRRSAMGKWKGICIHFSKCGAAAPKTNLHRSPASGETLTKSVNTIRNRIPASSFAFARDEYPGGPQETEPDDRVFAQGLVTHDTVYAKMEDLEIRNTRTRPTYDMRLTSFVPASKGYWM